jgi:hypothetical protein
MATVSNTMLRVLEDFIWDKHTKFDTYTLKQFKNEARTDLTSGGRGSQLMKWMQMVIKFTFQKAYFEIYTSNLAQR